MVGRAVSFGVVAVMIAAASAAAEEITFSKSGSYSLDHDIQSRIGAITIDASNVTLDLGGHTVRCSASNPSHAATIGISVRDVTNVHIVSGRITGCLYGIQSFASRLTVEQVDFSMNRYVGLVLNGRPGATVTHSRFSRIGGYADESYSFGIYSAGSDTVIEDDVFEDLYRQDSSGRVGEGVGVHVLRDASGVRIRRNTFTNSEARPMTIGIYFAGSAPGAVVANNELTNWHFGVRANGPIRIEDNRVKMERALAGSQGLSVGKGQASRNSITGYDQPITSQAVDDGTNTVTVLEKKGGE